MMRKKIELHPDEPVPSIGDAFAGGVVVTSFPELNNPNIIVEIPDDAGSVRTLMQNRVVDERDEHTNYGVLGFDSYTPLATDPRTMVGNTYPMIGITDDVRRRANYGAGDVISGIGDTGFYPQHQAYTNRNVYWWSQFSQTPRDGHGHGSHVSALQFGADPWGVATDATCAVFQVLNDQSGSGSESDIANAFRAIADYVVAQRVRAAVFNFSLGGSHSSVMNAGVAYMLQRNIWPICAAGNDGPSAPIGSPGDAAGVVAVGAIDRSYMLAPFSSGGGTASGVFCYAPGVDISSAMTGTVDGARLMSGTSMATPHISALFTLLAAAGFTFADAKNYVLNHMRLLTPPTNNGRGVFVIGADFGQSNDNPAPQPPGGGMDDPNALCDQQIEILDEAGTHYDLGIQQLDALQAAYPTRTPAVIKTVIANAMNELKMARYGPALDSQRGYVHAMDLAWEVKGALPKVDPRPTPEVPAWLKVGTGGVRYGSDSRHLAKVVIPPTWKTAPIVLLWHGGGWLQGDYNVIPQSTVLEVNDWFTRTAGAVLIEPTYRLGDVVNCIVDAAAAAAFFVKGLRDAGATGKVFYMGHSAGGHLAWFIALRPMLNAPIPDGVVSFAGAGLAMHANTRIPNPVVEQQIFNVAWGNRANWESYAPASHVSDRATPKLRGIVIQGQRDDQLDPQWAVEFMNTANQAGHNVTLDMQPMGDHFSVANPATNPQTARDVQRIMTGG